MTVIWKDFPEINRSLGFTVGYASTGVSLGCHAGTISNVSATFTSLYSPIARVSNIRVLKPAPEDSEIKLTKLNSGPYAGYFFPIEEEIQKINAHLQAKKISFDDFGDEICSGIAKACADTPIWILSDVINYYAPARNGGRAPTPEESTLKIENKISTAIIGRTVTFAEYLIKSKTGYVLESPIVQNPAHRSWGNYSLNRIWIWIPPLHLKRALGISAQYGEKNFPSIDSWKDIVFGDLKLSSDFNAKYFENILDPTITRETVEKVVFNDGIFPDEKRFTTIVKEA